MKQIKTALALLTLVSAAAFAQEKGSFADARDKKTYKTVKIGEQVWMAENLSFNVRGSSKCYGDKPENCKKYGGLYNWEGAMKACPKGWHLPNNAEWDVLYRFADGSSGTFSPHDSKTAGKLLKAKEGWSDNEGESGNGSDFFGFAALPGGYGYSGFYFANAGRSGNWWSATTNNSNAYHSIMSYNNEYTGWSSGPKGSFNSVRCVEGPVPEPVAKAEYTPTIKAEPAEPIKDARDKKTYKTVKIGEQVWMSENLSFNAKGSKCYDNKEANCKKYGRLYDLNAAMKACPAGWHLSTNAEWDKLYRYADGSSGTESPYKSGTAGKLLKAKEGWSDNKGESGNGSDFFGFAALPGGSGESLADLGMVGGGYSFSGAGDGGYWWNASENVAGNDGYVRYMISNSEYAVWGSQYEKILQSVRCVKD